MSDCIANGHQHRWNYDTGECMLCTVIQEQHTCLWPEWYHAGTVSLESYLECPLCHSRNITITGRYGSPGTGPGRRGRLGDPGAFSWVECRDCGNKSKPAENKKGPEDAPSGPNQTV